MGEQINRQGHLFIQNLQNVDTFKVTFSLEKSEFFLCWHLLEVLFFLIQFPFSNFNSHYTVYICFYRISLPSYFLSFPSSIVDSNQVIFFFFCSSSGSNSSATLSSALSYAFEVHCLVLRDFSQSTALSYAISRSTAFLTFFTVHKRKKEE